MSGRGKTIVNRVAAEEQRSLAGLVVRITAARLDTEALCQRVMYYYLTSIEA